MSAPVALLLALPLALLTPIGQVAGAAGAPSPTSSTLHWPDIEAARHARA